MASKKTYKRRAKKYKKKYKFQRQKKRAWRSKARGFEQELTDYRKAWNQQKWDDREKAWKEELMRDYVKRGDYDTAMQQQQQQFQQAQTDLADTILQRDAASGALTTAQEQLGGQAAQIQDFQSRIADFNAANAAREMQQKVAADYGNLVGTVGSVKANRGASNAYQNRWFRRPQQVSGGQIQAMTISDQSTNV